MMSPMAARLVAKVLTFAMLVAAPVWCNCSK
jgi:hypothetical protein